jgi:NitT/TauT family transport system ATP-binding protein
MNKIFELKNVSFVASLKGNFKKRVINKLTSEIQLPDDYGVVSIFGEDDSSRLELLRLLAGLDKPVEGSITGTFDISPLPFIPSQPSTLPWLNVLENISLPLRLNRKDDPESIGKAIEITGLDGYEAHYPSEKSEGFLFRMELARALAIKPPCILIDEPFLHNSREGRDEITQLLLKVAEEYKIFIVLTTSDHVQGINVGKIYYWFHNEEISKLEQVIGADNVLSLMR